VSRLTLPVEVTSLLAKLAMIPSAGQFMNKVRSTGMVTPQARLAASKAIGVPKMEAMKVKPLNIKVGMTLAHERVWPQISDDFSSDNAEATRELRSIFSEKAPYSSVDMNRSSLKNVMGGALGGAALGGGLSLLARNPRPLVGAALGASAGTFLGSLRGSRQASEMIAANRAARRDKALRALVVMDEHFPRHSMSEAQSPNPVKLGFSPTNHVYYDPYQGGFVDQDTWTRRQEAGTRLNDAVSRLQDLNKERAPYKRTSAPLLKSTAQGALLGTAIGGGFGLLTKNPAPQLDALVGAGLGTVGGYLYGKLGPPGVEARRQREANTAWAKDRGERAISAVRDMGQAYKDLRSDQGLALSKVGFATSQYSGTLGEAPFRNYASHIPPFRRPPLRAPVQKAMADELGKSAAITSAVSQLRKAQRVGLPKVSKPPGPSIQQVAKPVGFGKPLAGATKTV
jgi:uncharacterized membrane protein